MWLLLWFLYCVVVTCSDILEELIASTFMASDLVQVHAGVMQ